MKRFNKATILLAALSIGASVSSCADLGFGLDVDDGSYSPYWYGSGGYYSGLYDSPFFNGPLYSGPLYTPTPPPVIGNGPGSIGMPIRPARPPQAPPINNGPSNNIPTFTPGVNTFDRPGNMGQGNPSFIPKGQPIK